MFCTYVLSDPRTGAIRYVGCTCDTGRYLPYRLSNHVSASRRERTPKAAWIRSLVTDGLRPTIAEVRTYDDVGEAADGEFALIRALRDAGAPILNSPAVHCADEAAQ